MKLPRRQPLATHMAACATLFAVLLVLAELVAGQPGARQQLRGAGSSRPFISQRQHGGTVVLPEAPSSPRLLTSSTQQLVQTLLAESSLAEDWLETWATQRMAGLPLDASVLAAVLPETLPALLSQESCNESFAAATTVHLIQMLDATGKLPNRLLEIPPRFASGVAVQGRREGGG